MGLRARFVASASAAVGVAAVMIISAPPASHAQQVDFAPFSERLIQGSGTASAEAIPRSSNACTNPKRSKFKFVMRRAMGVPVGVDAVLNRRGTKCFSGLEWSEIVDLCDSLGELVPSATTRVWVTGGCLFNGLLVKWKMDEAADKRMCFLIGYKSLGAVPPQAPYGITYVGTEDDRKYCKV